jgi:hypothetical protein
MKKLTNLICIIFCMLISCSTKNQESTSAEADSVVNTVAESTSPDQAPASDNSDDATYNQLLSLLQAENLTFAETLINEKKFDINAYEANTHKHSNGANYGGFVGLLANFSQEKPNERVVQFLLKQKVDPNATGSTRLDEVRNDYSSYPVTTCHKKIGELLIKAGSKYALNRLMECATSEKDIVQIKTLLVRGANPTPALALACEKHDAGLFSELIKAGADKNEALFWAVEFEDVGMAKVILAQGAKILKGNYRVSHVAYSKNEELKELVKNAIDVSMYTDVDGMEGCSTSPLIAAARDGDIGAVDFILKVGGDPNVFCTDFDQCESALKSAEQSNQAEIAELLKKYGAKKPPCGS